MRIPRRRKIKYEQVFDGEWVPVRKRGLLEQCCGCGLVHVVDHRTRDGRIEVRATVDRRATAAARRNKD